MSEWPDMLMRERTGRRRRTMWRWVSVPVHLGAVGCGFIGMDFESELGLGGAGSVSVGGRNGPGDVAVSGGGTAVGGTLSGGRSNGGGQAGGASSGGTQITHAGAGGGSASGGAGSGGLSEADGGSDTGSGGSTLASCGAPGAVHQAFDEGIEVVENPRRGQWGIDVPNVDNTGTLGWTGAVGHLAPGALELNIYKPSSGRQVLTPKAPLARVDLTDKVVVAHVYVESGRDAFVQVFAFSEGANSWTDGDITALTVGQWTCATMDMAAPFYKEANFDASQVLALGVQIVRDGDSSFTDDIVVYVDDLSY